MAQHDGGVNKVLLLGEGDFTFTQALVQRFGQRLWLCSTSFDSRASLLAKYSDVRAVLESIQRATRKGAADVRITHDVDATKLEASPSIVFHAPCVATVCACARVPVAFLTYLATLQV